ncbi:Ig-like domain-containing protein, partial [Salinicola socius]
QVPAASDVDGTIAGYDLATDVGTGNGSLTFNADGSYSFAPGTDFDALAAGESRDVTFSYTATDNDGGVSAPKTVTITVTGTNDAPVAVADTGITGENATLNVSAAQGVLANDSDVDGGTLSVSAVNGVTGSVGQAITGSNGGTFTLNADGSYSFNPGTAFDRLAAGQTDTTKVSYTVSDGQGGTATSTLTVTVTGT